MEDYIPTLADYAVIIKWMTEHPGEDIPIRMEKTYKDAMRRAELREQFALLRIQTAFPD